jgi:hypothetical protein
MRKRIVIGLLAVVVIGVMAYFVSQPQPKRGSVEWHKREFVRARDGKPMMLRLRAAWDRFTSHGNKWRAADYWRRSEGMQSNRTALIRLGYLEERTFVVSNRPVNEVISNAWFNAATNIDVDFIRVNTRRGTNMIEVSTVRGDISKWEELIRNADVP